MTIIGGSNRSSFFHLQSYRVDQWRHWVSYMSFSKKLRGRTVWFRELSLLMGVGNVTKFA